MIRVVLYTREDCGLCDELREILEALQEEIPHVLREVDIEADPELLKRYHDRIPVVKVGPYTLEAPIDEVNLKVAMKAAADGQRRAQSASSDGGGYGIALNRVLLGFARHWLAIFNVVVFLYVALPFGAPVLMKIGAERPARMIYTLYSPLCHQLAYRSWFLFGEQPVYPAERAGLPLHSYEEISGLPASDLYAARAFLGNETVGYKVALCERDVAIYGGILLAGLLFGLLRRRLRPLPILAWFLLGILPLALDGGSQLLGLIPALGLPMRESTPFLRTLTGALFGLMNVWLAYPYVEESMRDTQAIVAAKLAAAGKLSPRA